MGGSALVLTPPLLLLLLSQWYKFSSEMWSTSASGILGPGTGSDLRAELFSLKIGGILSEFSNKVGLGGSIKLR
jgi:hypothetical protein